jgi:four helix bundle protein
MFDFQKLVVYQKSKQFQSLCNRIIIKIEIDKYIADQLRRAALSIPLNIAEGSGKFSKADRRNYYTTARASAFECVSILEIMYENDKISLEEYEETNRKSEEISKMLFAMIRKLN